MRCEVYVCIPVYMSIDKMICTYIYRRITLDLVNWNRNQNQNQNQNRALFVD